MKLLSMAKRFSLLLLLSLILFLTSCDDQDTPVEPLRIEGLVAYYPFNGNSANKFGDFDGTDSSVTYPLMDTAKVLETTGSGSYVQLGSDFDFAEKTISIRANCKLAGDGVRQIYGSDHATLKFGRTLISITEEMGKLYVMFNLSGQEYITEIEELTWYTFTIRNTANSFQYYIDDELVYSSAVNNVAAGSGNGVNQATVGTTRVLDRNFVGYIDDLYIYNIALDGDRLETLINR